MIFSSVRPYPSDEQEPKIKPRPDKYSPIRRIGGHLAKDENGQEVYFKGFPRKSDYPEKDGWRDEEEYYRQLQSWHNVWGEERRLLQYSSISRSERRR